MPFIRRSFGLFIVGVACCGVVGCAAPMTEEGEALAASESPVSTATSGALTLGDGTSIAFQDVSTPSSTTPLTRLQSGSATPLVVRVPLGAGLDRLLPQSGTSWTIRLGGEVFSLGPSSVTSISFPAMTKDTPKTNIHITIGFKPTELKYLKASGDVAKPTVVPSGTGGAGFQLSLGGAKTSSSTSSIGAWTIDSTGRGSFTLQIAAADLAGWSAWPAGEARAGTLTYQGEGVSLVLVVDKVTKDPPKHTDSLQFYTIKTYTEHTKLVIAKSDV